jgi:bacterial/archaeal transporter family-2 protein
MDKTLMMAVWAFFAGAGIPFMATLNGLLAGQLGGSKPAALCLFAVGLIFTAILHAIYDRSALSIDRIIHAPPHLFLGGIIVASYILSVTALAPRFGVGNTILFVMLAQIVSSTAIDHFGFFGISIRPLNLMRTAGVLLVMLGVVLTQLATLRETVK